MSLYDDLDTDKKAENVSGWASGIKFLQNHVHLKKAAIPTPKRDFIRKTVSLAPVKDLNKSKTVVNKDDNEEGGGAPAPSFILPYTTTVKESKKKPGLYVTRSSYLSVDPQWQIENEYDPMYPNDYEKALKDLRERRDKEAEEEEAKRKQDETREEEEYVPPVSKPSSGGVAIAPPSFYNEPESAEMHSQGGGNFGLGGGSGASAAARIMAKYGYKEGQGLGKKEQGMATALQVEKISHRTGRIIHEKDEPKINLLGSSLLGASLVQYGDADDMVDTESEDVMRPPSRVVLLNNMVGPGEVDDELEPEVKEECLKYGKVLGVTVFQMPDVDSEEAIRIFVEFEKVDSASKALLDLNGRFFGGRQVKAAYYDYEKFNNLELTE